ncbi:uncharacterized protein LOC107044195 [Diachasma alloeum]|uniref:uncharacterized protein LOC107044195 n=1 Tax=Diachasma alloeum TaxID=454923 RepID=UPI0007381FD5|nr:uncharacterized protein LOC107044195 [Diachasma alloeum]
MLHVRDESGRASITGDQPEILKVITEIATYGSATDDRRRTECIRRVRTLDDLAEKLKNDYGFNISRSGVYLRLIPRRADFREGKRHIKTVPVKLTRSCNETHQKHMDGKFAAATIHHSEDLASVLGPSEVFFISQDDKAPVPIRITAAKNQTPLLMYMEYRVTLPDHDWVVAPSHKLIPSVYAGVQIMGNEVENRAAVSYSGPTYVAMRSAKHSSSTAYSHALDMEHLFELPEFDDLVKTVSAHGSKCIKPIGIITVDGGPDANPRYNKVISTAISHFISKNLNALYIACNAPGRGAFNRVERRMAPLSKELAGVILPYDHYGQYLHSQGRTIDTEREKTNFAFAGTTLAELWSSMVLDDVPVISEFISPENSELDECVLQKKIQRVALQTCQK